MHRVGEIRGPCTCGVAPDVRSRNHRRALGSGSNRAVYRVPCLGKTGCNSGT